MNIPRQITNKFQFRDVIKSASVSSLDMNISIIIRSNCIKTVLLGFTRVQYFTRFSPSQVENFLASSYTRKINFSLIITSIETFLVYKVQSYNNYKASIKQLKLWSHTTSHKKLHAYTLLLKKVWNSNINYFSCIIHMYITLKYVYNIFFKYIFAFKEFY